MEAGTRRRNLGLLLYSTLLLVVCRVAVLDWLSLAAETFHYSHLVLVPLISAALMWRNRGQICANARWSVRASLAVFAVGLLLWAATGKEPLAHDGLTWSLVAVGLMWLAGFVLLYGPAAVKAAMFPLGFLLFAVPLPEAVFSRMVDVLQALSVDTTAMFLNLAGVPFLRTGTVFALPEITIEVAKECSGIRSALVLLVLGVLIARFLLARPWTRLAFCLAILPITVLQNGLRIVTITLLGVHVDPRFLTARWIHNLSGTVFFGLTLAALVLPFILLLRWIERRTIGVRPRELSTTEIARP